MKLARLNVLDVVYVARNMRERDRLEINATNRNEDPDDFAMRVVQYYGDFSGVAWDDRRPVACFGCTEAHPGVWEAWMFATDDLPGIGLELTRHLKKVMLPHLIALGAHRVEARSMAGHEDAHRWLKSLGAVQEARLRRYGKHGEDFILFRLDPVDV